MTKTLNTTAENINLYSHYGNRGFLKTLKTNGQMNQLVNFGYISKKEQGDTMKILL